MSGPNSNAANEPLKEEYRKYVEKSNLIDLLTKALLPMYDSDMQSRDDSKEKAFASILKSLGGPSKEEYAALQAENARLKQELEMLRKRSQ